MAKRQRDEKAASIAADTNRKRSKVVKQVMQPIEKQIFKDLVFCMHMHLNENGQTAFQNFLEVELVY